jgi:hypothetical protein
LTLALRPVAALAQLCLLRPVGKPNVPSSARHPAARVARPGRAARSCHARRKHAAGGCGRAIRRAGSPGCRPTRAADVSRALMIAIDRRAESSVETNIGHNLDDLDQVADYPAMDHRHQSVTMSSPSFVGWPVILMVCLQPFGYGRWRHAGEEQASSPGARLDAHRS